MARIALSHAPAPGKRNEDFVLGRTRVWRRLAAPTRPLAEHIGHSVMALWLPYGHAVPSGTSALDLGLAAELAVVEEAEEGDDAADEVSSRA
jgi:hypothetical protein